MKQRSNRWRIGIGAATLVCAGLGLAWAKPAPTPATRLMIKIDLSIPTNGMKVTKTGVDGTDHQVRIDVTVRATSIGKTKVCSGPFKVKVESTEDPTTDSWTLVGTAGIANMCVGGALAKIPSEKRWFDDTVPAGELRKYRATVDFLDQVDEANETNNVESAGYVAR
jgi:hypothetical protein